MFSSLSCPLWTLKKFDWLAGNWYWPNWQYCCAIKFAWPPHEFVRILWSTFCATCDVATLPLLWLLAKAALLRWSTTLCTYSFCTQFFSELSTVGGAVACTESLASCPELASAFRWRVLFCFVCCCSFLYFMRRFWNQILIWRSVRDNAIANSILRGRHRYFVTVNSFSSSTNWTLVYAVRDRFVFFWFPPEIARVYIWFFRRIFEIITLCSAKYRGWFDLGKV